MLINKGYRYRIYPTKAQEQLLARTFGCCRFVYNHFLEVRSKAWKDHHETLPYVKTSALLTELKHGPDHPWLREVDSMALQEALRDLDRAFRNFFAKRAGYPKFHKKGMSLQSFRTRNQQNGIRIAAKDRVRLPVIGILKTKVSRIPGGRILHATVTRCPSGRYYLSLCVEEEPCLKPNAGRETGIDVGLKAFYTDSDRHTVQAPKPLKALEKKLLRQQRRLSRMLRSNTARRDGNGRPVWIRPLKECRNLQKQRQKVAKIHERITDIRNDFLHKESRKLVSGNRVLCVESLNVKGMVKNHRLAKAIHDASWSRFFRMLEYKAPEHGCTIVHVPTFFPSSRTCSACGYQNPQVRDLAVRTWTCPCCGTVHDRDNNAAVNILKKGLAMIQDAG